MPVRQFTIQSDTVASDLASDNASPSAGTSTGEHFNDPPAALGTILAAAVTGTLLAPDRDTESIDVFESAKRQITATLDDSSKKRRQREPGDGQLTQHLLRKSGGWIDDLTGSERHIHNASLDAAEGIYRVKINGNKLKTLDLASTNAAIFGLFSTIIREYSILSTSKSGYHKI